jgi:MarR family transcriptional regulator, organic hydroperoxide resistance regulator
MPKNSTPYARELAELAMKIMGAFHGLNRRQGHPESLTMRQYQAMILLSVHKQLTVSEMCEKLTLAPSTGTELFNRLLQMDYLEKQATESDHRIVGLQLTAAGNRVLLERQEQVTKMLSVFLDRFNEKDASELMHCFRRIHELMQANAPHPHSEE